MAQNLNLASLTAAQGFYMNDSTTVASGYSVSRAGDVNGDGYDDVIIGAPGGLGAVYVIFGNATTTNNVDLSNLKPWQGFSLMGSTNCNCNIGLANSGAGDINNDGYDDIIIGSISPLNSNDVMSFIIFGNTTISLNNINLSNLEPWQGFFIDIESCSSSGGQSFSVSGAGNTNNDSYADIIIGCPGIYSGAGASYVIFGNATTNLNNISVRKPNLIPEFEPWQGFVIYGTGTVENAKSGYSVSSAGDFNGDGVDDIIIGAPWDGEFNSHVGVSYVVFGSNNSFSNINLSLLSGSKQGFTVTNIVDNALCGFTVSGAGDVNNDGWDDVIIGCYDASQSSASAYVIFGQNENLGPITLENQKIQGANGDIVPGFCIISTTNYISSVSGIGDISNDDYDDIILGFGAGTSYVILGDSTLGNSVNAVVNLASFPSPQGFSIIGNPSDADGWSVGGAGDINGDNYGDIIIGCCGYFDDFKNYNSIQGTSYVVYGAKSNYVTPTPTLAPTPTTAPTSISSPDSSSDNFINSFEFKIVFSAASFLSSVMGGWFFRKKIAFYILNNWGHEYKLLYKDTYIPLQKNEIGLRLNGNNLNCVVKTKECPISVDDSGNDGISKGLYNLIVQALENPLISQSFTLIHSEKNQIRDYLIKHHYIEATRTYCFLKSYTELGYVKGTIYKLFLDNFEAEYTRACKKQARSDSSNGQVSMNKYSGGARVDSLDDHSISNPIVSAPSTQQPQLDVRMSDHSSSHDDVETNARGSNVLEVSRQDTDIQSGAKTNQRSCVVCSIDALIDPQHVRNQDEEFARFGSHLTYAYQDLAKLVSEQFSTSQRLLKDHVMPADRTNPIHETGFPYADGLSSSLPRIQNAVEAYPLVKYISSNIVYPLVENYLPESLQNITLPEISNTMLVTAHMSIGHLYAWQQSQGNVPFYIVESVAKSSSFAARLGVTKFINDYKDALKHNEQTITKSEAIKHCVSTILTYTVPDLLICAAAKTAMPGYKCSDLNLGAKLSFAGSECYWSYKASQEPIEPTMADVVAPYIADLAAGVAAYVNGYGLMGVISSVVAADWMSRVVMDTVPSEIKIYADLSLDSTVEFVTAKVLGGYSFAFENESVN